MAVEDHAKEQMRAIGQATTADHGNALTLPDGLGALRQRRDDQSKVTIYANEPLVLDQNLKASNAVAVNANDPSRRDSQNWAADQRRKIDAVMKGTSQRSVRQHARSVRRGDTRRFNG